MTRLADTYQKQIVPKLKEEFEIKNVRQVPKLEKIVMNVGFGKAQSDSKIAEIITNTLRKVTGQQPLSTAAKHSIAGFKLRQGQKIGLKVTLRRARMYDFLDRLVNVTLPRVRDFHGLARASVDKSGNYTFGLSDQAVFPELTYEDTIVTHGLEITLVTSTSDRTQSLRLLELLGLPLEKEAKRG